MGTKETLERMPKHVVDYLEHLRSDYNMDGFNYAHKAATRNRAAGYTLGLRDAGLITERERQILFIYTTV